MEGGEGEEAVDAGFGAGGDGDGIASGDFAAGDEEGFAVDASDELRTCDGVKLGGGVVGFDAEEEELGLAGVEGEVAEAGGEHGAAVDEGEGNAAADWVILRAEGEEFGFEVEGVVELGEEPLAEDALDVWRVFVDGVEGGEEELLGGRDGGVEGYLVVVAAGGGDGAGGGGEVGVEGGGHADLLGEASVDEVDVGAGVEQETVGAVTVDEDAIDDGAAIAELEPDGGVERGGGYNQ